MQRSHLRHRAERLGLIIGIVLALAVVAVVINLVLESDQGPLEPTPQPTLMPTQEPTQVATPSTPGPTFEAEPEPAPGSLLDMMGYAPDRLADDSLPLSDIARYADIERWMELQGVEIPSDPDDPGWDLWQSQLPALALPEVLATRGTDGIWIDTYGFGLHDVNQVLAVGSAPDYVIVMRGDFDAAALNATWAENGYQAVRVDNVTYWSLYPGDSVDLSAPASRPALGNMNNLVLLEDGTLIATSRSGRMEQTIRTISGENPALADNAEISSLLTTGVAPENLLTAVMLKGNVLEEVSVGPSALTTATPSADLPQASMMLAGLQYSPDSAGRTDMVIVTVYDSAEGAVQAEERVHQQFAAGVSDVTGEPYAARVTPIAMRTIASQDGAHLLLIQLAPMNGYADWLQILEERDFGYIMWPRLP